MYPELVVRGAKAAGVSNVDVLSVRGSTSRATKRAADGVHEIGIGEIAAGIRWIAAQGYDGAILAGQINPLSLFRSRFDEEVKAWLRGAMSSPTPVCIWERRGNTVEGKS